MSLRRLVSLSVVSTVAAVWAAVMVLLGLGVLIDGRGALPVPESLFSFLGLGAISGGQFVFMVLVADRLFPHANRRMTALAEVVAFTFFSVGVGTSIYLFQAGAGL